MSEIKNSKGCGYGCLAFVLLLIGICISFIVVAIRLEWTANDIGFATFCLVLFFGPMIASACYVVSFLIKLGIFAYFAHAFHKFFKNGDDDE